MQRVLHPELLDSLSPDHPDAQHNRRDLRRINRVMGNHSWLAKVIPPLLRPGERALEIGAGMGELGSILIRRGVAVDGLDLWPRPREWPAQRLWHVADLRGFQDYDRYTAVFGNLIFHQFSFDELAMLGAKLDSVQAIVACEPVRQRRSQAAFRVFSRLLAMNHVTRHDAHVTIAAGFRGHELPDALGLDAKKWNVRCETTCLGAYRMLATRRLVARPS